METEANILNFEVATTVVSFIIGTTLLIAGMYGKTGSSAEAQAEERFRHTARGAAISAPKHRTPATR
jgi:hypothetical protein